MLFRSFLVDVGEIDGALASAGFGVLPALRPLAPTRSLADLPLMPPLQGLLGNNSVSVGGALESLNRHFARAGGPLGIRCNSVAPGVIDTEMTRRFPPPRVQDIPMGRVGTPAEVASVVAFLAGPGAAYVTGASIPIAGGLFFC